MLRHLLLGLVCCGALLTSAGSASAQTPTEPAPVNVATFNMAWAGTLDDFKKHLDVCSAPSVNWCETRARWAPGTNKAPPEEVARAAACEAATMAAAGGRDASMKVAPCGAYRDSQPRPPGSPPPDVSAVRKPEAYAEKLAGLRGTVEALIERDGVRVIAFQEVKSAQAVQAVLGKFADRFDVCEAQHSGFQTLAFAWDKSLSSAKGVCTTHSALALLDPANDPAAFRRVRPGLALQLSVNGAPVTFMNVHLKATCASATNSNPRFPTRLLTDPVEACEVFNRQVPIFEDWIDAVAAKSPRYVILGDFNRRIDEEQALVIAKDQVRTDGSDPASRNTVGADGRVKTKYLWPEIADGSRALFQLPLNSKDPACTGFTGLDHIVVSGPVHAALAKGSAADIGTRKNPVMGREGQPIETSDHCPQVARLLL
jgi:endonuclease/exonuclease/phosphatase family metal-dependent hydrolase